MKASALFLLLTLTAMAAAAPLERFPLLYASTYSHDNSFCRLTDSRFELQIRSTDKYAEAGDINYGEYPFLLLNKVPYKLNLNNDIGRYRLIEARQNHCSKSLAMVFNPDELTLFYAQDNRPFPDLLIIIHFNVQTLQTRLIHTALPFIKYQKAANTLQFSSYIPHTQISELLYQGEKFTHLKVNFPIWKSFDGQSLSSDPLLTYSQFEWGHFFADIEEFKKEFAWNQKDQSFAKTSYQLIINHSLQKRCLLIHQQWRCRSFSSSTF